jgi:hypothetical protein
MTYELTPAVHGTELRLTVTPRYRGIARLVGWLMQPSTRKRLRANLDRLVQPRPGSVRPRPGRGGRSVRLPVSPRLRRRDRRDSACVRGPAAVGPGRLLPGHPGRDDPRYRSGRRIRDPGDLHPCLARRFATTPSGYRATAPVMAHTAARRPGLEREAKQAALSAVRVTELRPQPVAFLRHVGAHEGVDGTRRLPRHQPVAVVVQGHRLAECGAKFRLSASEGKRTTGGRVQGQGRAVRTIGRCPAGVPGRV